MGKLDRVLLIRMTLSPLDKYKRFQLANLLSIFSKIEFHIVLSLNLAPKGRPRYFIGREPCLQPRTTSKIGQYHELPQLEPILTCPSLSLDPTLPQTKYESYKESKFVLNQPHKKLECHPQKGDETPPRIFPPSFPH